MRLAIGTVQFGLSYGVANTVGRTTPQEAKRILLVAEEGGLDTMDTAAAYGDSETVLGTLGIDAWRVISKVPPVKGATTDGCEWVLTNLRASLQRLNLTRLDGLLLHHAADLLGPAGESIAAGLIEAKQLGLVDKIGYSIYSPSLLPELVARMVPDLIQAPLNALDQRLVNSGWLARLSDTGTEVHTRSTFLQGLLLMPPANRPAYFDSWTDVLARWDAFVAAEGGCPLSASLGYIKAQAEVSRVVVGVDSTRHLEQLLTAWEKASPSNCEILACDDVKLIEPTYWTLT